MTTTQEITLENWQFALAPLTEKEQKRIVQAIHGLEVIARHIKADSTVVEMEEVTRCFVELVCVECTNDKHESLQRLFNQVFIKALDKQS